MKRPDSFGKQASAACCSIAPPTRERRFHRVPKKTRVHDSVCRNCHAVLVLVTQTIAEDPVKIRATRRAGLSLVELLCVIAIIAILAALYLPTIARAFMRVKRFLGGE